MMLFIKLFLAFLVPGIIGYGGGPASIPLFKYEVVNRYGLITETQFGEVVAISNIFPGVAAAKIAGSVGYMTGYEAYGVFGGILGVIVALIGVVGPSLILMILLLNLLTRHKSSPRVKRLTNYVRPIIAVLLGILAYDFFHKAVVQIEWMHTLLLGGISLLLTQKLKVHPALIIIGALIYGAIFIR
jgi:chromate transporter